MARELRGSIVSAAPKGSDARMLSDLANFLLAPVNHAIADTIGYLNHLIAFLTPLTHFLGEVAVAVGILAVLVMPRTAITGTLTYWAFHWVWHNAAAGETFAVPLVISVFLFLTFLMGLELDLAPIIEAIKEIQEANPKPANNAPAYIEDFRQVNPYGDAGFAKQAQVHRALSGEDPSGRKHPLFLE